MSLSIHIRVPQSPPWAPIEIERRLRGGMGEALAYLRLLIVDGTPVDRGILRGSIVTEIRGTPLGLHGVVAPGVVAAQYADVMELGRRPGAPPPPTSVIAAWATRHGIAAEAAFVIARAIGRRGLKGHHMFQNAAEKGADQVGRIFASHFRF